MIAHCNILFLACFNFIIFDTVITAQQTEILNNVSPSSESSFKSVGDTKIEEIFENVLHRIKENKTMFQKGGQSCLNEDEIYLSAPELIKKKGLPFELHEIITKDGYILGLHRIPASGKPVVLAFHGMTLSSRDFLINCDRKAFGYKMSDAGFDVWLANTRGNLYSRNHTRLSILDRKFWDFTIDDVIKFDVPAIVDYILKVTGQKKLNWVGYSLGTSLALGLGSVHPEYYKKINLIFLMGTTAYVGNATSPILRALAPLSQIQDIAMTTFNHGEIVPPFLFPTMRQFFIMCCYPEAKLEFLGICSHILYMVGGIDQNQSNPTTLPLLLGGTPGPFGIKMISQWFQWVNSGTFSYYNYGPQGNLDKYGSIEPPNYDLRKATGRFVNMWAQNDWLSVPKDVDRVVRELPNLVMNIKIKMESFTHLDFAYGKDADIYVYDEIISIIKKS